MGGGPNKTYVSANNIPGLSVNERLYRDAADRVERNFFNTMNEEENFNSRSRQSLGGGQINKNSQWISENSNMFNGNLKDFYSRQQAFLQKQQEKRDKAQDQYGEAA